MASNRTDRSTSCSTPTQKESGLGAVLVAAAAAIGAAALIVQMGGCASAPEAESVSSESGSSWTSANYKAGWYQEDSETAMVDEPADESFPEEVAYTGLGDASAVRVSLFPDFDVDEASFEEAGSGDTNLTQVSFAAEGADFDPDVSRDGEWMVFASTQHHEQPDLYRKSVEGRVVTQLTSDPGQDLMPEIAPDGRRVAFASDRHGNWDVFVMSAEGGPVTQVTFDDAQELHPTWSPDGKKLCYCRYNDRTGNWELWTVSVDKPGTRSFVCEGMFPRWSPDAEDDRVLFQRSRKRGDRLYGVWTIDIVDGEGVNPTEIVAAGDAAIMHPTWSPDGKRIAYTVVNDPSVAVDGMPVESDIWTIGHDGTGRIALTAGGYRNMRPEWGRDGRVFFMSNRGGQEVIWAASGGFPEMAGEAVAEATEESYDDMSAAESAPAMAGVSDAE